jgi:hypothetical protein
MENAEGEVKKNNVSDVAKRWWLEGALVVLILLIVGLTIGIIVVKMNESSFEPVAVEEEEEIVVTEDDLFDGETIEDAKERLRQDKQWDKIKGDIKDKVEKLLNNDPVDVAAINKVYNEGMAKANEYGRHDYVVEIIELRNNSFLSKNLNQEALDALLTVDPEIFDNVEKYYYYTKIINVANELGNQELMNKYTAKRAEVEEDFTAQSERTRRFAESVGADVEAFVGKEQE